MTSKTRRRPHRGAYRMVLAANVRTLMELRFPLETNKPMALAKKAGVSLSTVQRVAHIAGMETGARVDEIESLARAFGVHPHELLIPHFAEQEAKAKKRLEAVN